MAFHDAVCRYRDYVVRLSPLDPAIDARKSHLHVDGTHAYSQDVHPLHLLILPARP
jgi:hypothetical protein